ncbi:MAG TPA: carboxypeptidase regulatory-like domain-containing protein [bacterium]|nr:carboxypeptidase regulatory-like domain-containing protein [bacterium]
MNKIWHRTFIGLALTAAGALGAPAAAPAATAVHVLSEGVGVGGRAPHADYPLKLTFAERKSGAYLADVTVKIRNSRGHLLLDRASPGPWLFVKLPPGTYWVQATAPDGKATATKVSLSGKGQDQVHLTW